MSDSPRNGRLLVPAALPVRIGTPAEGIADVLPVAPPRAVEPILDVLPAKVLDVGPATLPEPVLDVLPAPRHSWIVRLLLGIWWTVVWLFGAGSLILGLAILTGIPVLQLLSLGYLLEVGGRIGRTGKLRNGFPGVWQAAWVGFLVVGWSVLMLPLRLVSSLAVTPAQLIDPGGPVAVGWQIGLTVLTVVLLVVGLLTMHILLACTRGFRLCWFIEPVAHPLAYYVWLRDTVWDFVMSLRLPYYFWLGLRGFVGGMMWLGAPITLIALGREAPLLGFLGGFLLAVVLLYVPFLQMRFAAQNRFRAFFELGAVRAAFRRAPVAFAFSFFVTLLLALPLYLLKIEMIPREVAFLPGLFFIVSIFPTRFLCGWAYARSEKRTMPRNWFFRWTSRLFMLPVSATYVLIVFFTQFTSWGGIWSLYEQHAFLLPAPFWDFAK